MLATRRIFTQLKNQMSQFDVSLKIPLRRYSVFKQPTMLHTVMKNYSSGIIKAYLQNIPTSTAVDMLTTVNNKGETPIDLSLDNPQLRHYEQHNMHNEFIKMIVENQKTNPLNMDISIDESLSPDMRMAYKIINDTRKIITASQTHPDCNQLNFKDRNELGEEIRRQRNQIYNNIDTCNYLSMLTHSFSAVSETHIGNCQEYALAMVYLMMNTNKELWAGTVSIENGNHIFAIWDTKPLMNPNDYLVNNTNVNAFFCDAWGGVAGQFNHYDFVEKMKCYKQYPLIGENDDKNILLKFNPEYHKLKLINQIHCKQRFFEKPKGIKDETPDKLVTIHCRKPLK